MISSYVGKAASNGMPWALRAERWIDWGAELLGDEPNHCRRAWLFYKVLE